MTPAELLQKSSAPAPDVILADDRIGAAASPLGTDDSVPDRFARVARRHPDAPAVIGEESTLTYRELDRLSNRIAHSILATCRAEKQRVGLLLHPGPGAIAAMLGALKAGAIYVPLDPSYPENRTAYMVDEAELALLVTDRRNGVYADRLAGGALPVVDLEGAELSPNETDPGLAIDPDAIAYILYTSGSTGQPKGVLQTHRNLLHFIESYSRTLEIRAGERLSLVYSFSFSASLMDIYGSLLNGATACHYDLKRRGLNELAAWLRQNQIAVYHSVPTVFRHLMDTLHEGHAFPAIRAVDLGGEPVYQREVETFRRHFPPGCLLVNHLAFTEASVTAQYAIDHETEIGSERVPVGFPAEGMTVLIVDEQGEALDRGHVGEIAVQSRYLSPGYWRQPELTASSFSPASDGQERIYRTGDLGRVLEDGRVEHLGRKDARVKIRGYSVEVAEIEQALLRLDGVKEAAVIAREDTPGDPRLVGYFVFARACAPSSAELRGMLAASLPDYMLPAAFVRLEALPATESGKVNRRALPAPARDEMAVSTELVQPRTDIEKWLVATWEQELCVRPVGIQDHFFEIGGNSLTAARVFTRIEDALGRRLSAATLFQAPTIEALAAILEQEDWSPEWKCLVPIRTGGTRPPSFWVHHALGDILFTENLTRHLPQDMPCYGLRDILFTENLTRHLPQDMPCYGLQSLGLDGKTEPLTRIEEMAAYYLREVRAVQPHGPYYLGGYSLGGVIALEMAQQLLAAGEKVGLLVMLDSMCPVSSPHYPKRSRLFERKLIPLMFDAEHHLVVLRREGSKAYFRHLLLTTMNVVKRRSGMVAARFRPRKPAGPGARVNLLNRRASRIYRPRPYPGRITYFYVAEGHYDDSDTRLGWSDFAEEGFELHLTPGTHRTGINEPHIQALAAKLTACFQRAWAESTRR
jgi:amino acid adenylation domain-containing protein